MTKVEKSKWHLPYPAVGDLRIDCPKCNKKEAWFVNAWCDINKDGRIRGCKCKECGFEDDILLAGCTPEVRGMTEAYSS